MPHLKTDDGIKLYYEETGTGIPIVFVHEFAGDYRSFETQVRHFGKHYRCIAYNARGYPPSDVPNEGERYSQDRARDDIRAVLDALKIDKAHIVGLSMGGFAALHFGFAYSARARSIVIAGCGYGAALDKREQFAEEAEASAQRFEKLGMTKAAEAYALGPTRVQYQNKDPRGWREFADQFSGHSTDGAVLTMRGVQKRRPSLFDLVDKMQDDHGADPGHDRRRGLALPGARAADEADDSDRSTGRDAEFRAHHQSRGACGVQCASRRILPGSGRRDVAKPRPARDGGIDPRPLGVDGRDNPRDQVRGRPRTWRERRSRPLAGIT